MGRDSYDEEVLINTPVVPSEPWESILAKVAAWANLSPDPSTQNAAVLVAELEDGTRQIIWETMSVNEFPVGVKYSDERWERPLKYEFIEHAERNAIYRAAYLGIPTAGLTLVAVWAACSDCGRAIIQSGIQRVVTLAEREEAHGHWGNSITNAFQMIYESEVDVEYIPGPLGVTFDLRRNGKPFTP